LLQLNQLYFQLTSYKSFARLKHYRSIATRYDKLERNYASTLALGCCLMWLPMWIG